MYALGFLSSKGENVWLSVRANNKASGADYPWHVANVAGDVPITSMSTFFVDPGTVYLEVYGLCGSTTSKQVALTVQLTVVAVPATMAVPI